eukprot:Selendium_serpulae@DN5088_c0_g1_i3.p1
MTMRTVAICFLASVALAHAVAPRDASGAFLEASCGNGKTCFRKTTTTTTVSTTPETWSLKYDNNLLNTQKNCGMSFSDSGVVRADYYGQRCLDGEADHSLKDVMESVKIKLFVSSPSKFHRIKAFSAAENKHKYIKIRDEPTTSGNHTGYEMEAVDSAEEATTFQLREAIEGDGLSHPVVVAAIHQGKRLALKVLDREANAKFGGIFMSEVKDDSELDASNQWMPGAIVVFGDRDENTIWSNLDTGDSYYVYNQHSKGVMAPWGSTKHTDAVTMRMPNWNVESRWTMYKTNKPWMRFRNDVQQVKALEEENGVDNSYVKNSSSKFKTGKGDWLDTKFKKLNGTWVHIKRSNGDSIMVTEDSDHVMTDGNDNDDPEARHHWQLFRIQHDVKARLALPNEVGLPPIA